MCCAVSVRSSGKQRYYIANLIANTAIILTENPTCIRLQPAADTIWHGQLSAIQGKIAASLGVPLCRVRKTLIPDLDHASVGKRKVHSQFWFALATTMQRVAGLTDNQEQS